MTVRGCAWERAPPQSADAFAAAALLSGVKEFNSEEDGEMGGGSRESAVVLRYTRTNWQLHILLLSSFEGSCGPIC